MQSIPALAALFKQYASTQDFAEKPIELYDPVRYILSIGGKQLRPLLVLAAYNLFKKDLDKAVSAAFAIEVFHNFTLMHDDIMDAAPLRRGKATTHQVFGTNSAILSGDVMLIKAYQYLMEAAAATNSPLDKVLATFNEVAIGVCEGQQMDMNFEERDDVTIPEYIEMISLKTSILLGGALKIGALLAGATETDAHHLYTFGLDLGIAFQLQDDYLDTFGDPEKFGKKVGGDIAQNKKTYLYLKALELGAARPLLAELKQLYSSENSLPEAEKIAQVKGVFVATNVSTFAKDLMHTYYENSLMALSKVGVPSENLLVLRSFAAELMVRDI